MSDQQDDQKTYQIPVRDEGSAGAAGEPAREPGPSSPEAAGDAVPPASGPGDAGYDEPVVLSVEGSGPEEDEGPPIVLPPIEETVERAKYIELLREHRRTEEDLKKAQAASYEDKVKLHQAEERVAEQKALVARTQAEFQNFRRRIEKEREEAARYVYADLLADILPVLDNFDRAMSTAPRPDTLEDFHKGMSLIRKQLQDILAKYDLKPLDATGSAFDPNFHEAVTRVPSPSVPLDHVVADLQRGYLYKDRLLRPALVAVSEGGSAESEDAGGEGSSPASAEGKPDEASG